MSAEKLRKFIDENKNLFGWEDTLLLNGVCNTLNDYEQQGAKITITGGVIPATQPEATTQFDKQVDEAIKLVEKCFRSAWDVAVSRTVIEEQACTAAVKLTEIMVDYIKSEQRINATSNMAEIAKEYLKPKPGNIPFPDPIPREKLLLDDDFITKIARKMLDTPISDIRYKQHEEKLINADDFLNETPDVKSSVEMLKKALTEESGDSVAMQVLCYDSNGNLKKVTGVHQVLFQILKQILKLYENEFVYRIVTEAKADDPITECALLIS